MPALPAMRNGVVGIAGAGGLGSNAAMALGRAGIGKLIIADFDRIEPANLDRQYYFTRQVGRAKVLALRDNLAAAAPRCVCEISRLRVDRSNLRGIFGKADLLIEALDKEEEKAKLIRAWLSFYPGRPIITASGLAGFGRNNALRTRRIGNMYVCGDGTSGCADGAYPMAPRVGIVANMQANLAVELLCKTKGPRR